MLPIEHFSDSLFSDLGSFQVTDKMAIGESLEQLIPDAAGIWRVRWIDIPTSDRIYDDIEAEGGDTDGRCCQQLQVFLEDVDPNELMALLTPLCTLPVDAANFRVGDSSLASIFETFGPLSPLFDGVEGRIGGAGASVYLGGDGRAEVHLVSDEFGPQLVHVNLK